MAKIVVDSFQYSKFHKDQFPEKEFERNILDSLCYIYNDFIVLNYNGEFEYEGEKKKPDLLLIAKDYTKWIVVEIELIHHSLFGHVLPQVEVFSKGRISKDAAMQIISQNNHQQLDNHKLKQLIDTLPEVLVLANDIKKSWSDELERLNVKYAEIELYENDQGQKSFRLNGYHPRVKDRKICSINKSPFMSEWMVIHNDNNDDLKLGRVYNIYYENDVVKWFVEQSATPDQKYLKPKNKNPLNQKYNYAIYITVGDEYIVEREV